MMKLYHYEHCPYCVKARMIFGLARVDVEEIILLNDDEATPVSMVGKKMVPILEKDDGSFMPESMDIVHYIDGLDGMSRVNTHESDALNRWLEESRQYVYGLCMPRWIDAPLDEFATEGAKEYFRKKKEAYIGAFDEHLAASDEYIAKANEHLGVLDGIIEADYAAGGALSESDFHLFATLRSLSIVKGLRYPPTVEAYRQSMAARADVALLDVIAR